MIWTSRAFERELGDGWTLNAKGTLAVSLPQYEHDAIFSASPSVMSAMSMRIGTGSTGAHRRTAIACRVGAPGRFVWKTVG